MSGFAVDQRPVGRQLVLEVCRDFDFETPLAPPVPQLAPRPAAGRSPEACVVAAARRVAIGTGSTGIRQRRPGPLPKTAPKLTAPTNDCSRHLAAPPRGRGFRDEDA